LFFVTKMAWGFVLGTDDSPQKNVCLLRHGPAMPFCPMYFGWKGAAFVPSPAFGTR
jgi:hypothetical protein